MLSLAAPWLLLLLPLPWLIRRLIPRAQFQKSDALKVPFFYTIKTLHTTHTHPTHRSFWRSLWMYLAWGLLVVAAAGPQWLGAPIELPRSGRNIMLAVDISQSMRSLDMTLNQHRVNRLVIVKSAANEFIQKRTGDRLGLILFGTRAYLQTPLTFDRKTVAHMLNDATIGLAGQKTAIGDAMGVAIKRLQHTPKQSRILILLTDGANNAGSISPISAANMAAKDNIKIFTIGLGATHLLVPDYFSPQMKNPSKDLDEKSLKKIAKITSGLFFRARNTAELNRVYNMINQLVPVTADKNTVRPFKPLYPWPLALALLISFILIWRLIKRVKPKKIK